MVGGPNSHFSSSQNIWDPLNLIMMSGSQNVDSPLNSLDIGL